MPKDIGHGFKTIAGTEAANLGDDVISGNATAAYTKIVELLGRTAQLELAAGFNSGMTVTDDAVAPLIEDTVKLTGAAVARAATKAVNDQKGVANGVATLDAGVKIPAAQIPDSPSVKGTAGRKFRLIAGTIRNTGTGWHVIDDTGHRPTGVTGVTASATSIAVAFAATAKIVSFVCGPDETYAAWGLRVGASVGTSSANISCYQENEHRIGDYVTWDGTAWTSLAGVFNNMSFANSALTLNHEAMGTTRLTAQANARPPANAAANTVASIGSMGDTSTLVELRTPAGAVITTLSNPTRLWVERAGLRKAVAVDPATLTEAAGNLWFIGVVED